MSTFFSVALLLLLVANINCQNVSKATNKSVINIGVLLEFPVAQDTKGYMWAITLAQSLIKNSTEFKHLTDSYQLNLIIKYDYTLPTKTIANAYKISNEYVPQPLAFIGPINSKNVDYATKTLGSYKPPIVTTAHTVPPENLRRRYVYSASSGVDQEVEARMAFMKKFDWKRAAIVYSLRNNYHSTYVDKMLNTFKDKDYKIHLTGGVAIEVRKSSLDKRIEILNTKLKVLKQNDTKIFVAELEPYEALVLFCEVYNLKMYGEDIVWIISSYAKTIEKWLEFNDTQTGQIVTCSPENIREAANGAFMFDRQIIRQDSLPTASGLTADEFLDRVIEMAKNHTNQRLQRDNIKYSALAFDALWAVATALNNSIDPLKKLNKTLSVEGLPFMNLFSTAKLVLNTMTEVDFQGIGGPYSYDKSNSPNKDGTIQVLHYQDGGTRLVRVGSYDTKQNNLTFINGTKYLWGSDGVPRDRSTINTNVLSVSSSLFIAIATLAAIGIFLGILFLTFNLVYGKYKFIKLSAPLFNNIIASGCILCLVSVFPFGIHDISNPKTAFPIICKARAWILTIGFSLAFGAMFVKTWRIYKICTNKKLRMKLGPLSNWYLLSLIGGIVFIDLIVLITWELVDPMDVKQVSVVEKRQDLKSRFIYFNDVINVCTAKQMVVWLTIIYVYKGILILYGLFLAYETRNVIYAHLNDSRVIGICVYNVVVLSIVGAFLSLLLEEKNYQEMFIVLSVCIIFPAVATISLMMFPKIAYRCKTNNLDDTETMANGMRDVTTYNGTTHNGTTMAGPQIQVTSHVSNNDTPQPSSSKDARFSYHKEVEGGSSEASINGENV